MSRARSERPVSVELVKRRRYTEEFKAEAVQMLLDRATEFS
jgi:transposase-like protein